MTGARHGLSMTTKAWSRLHPDVFPESVAHLTKPLNQLKLFSL